jgi:hypothetical protein
VFAPYVAEVLWFLAFPLARMSFVWFYGQEDEQPG